MSWHPTARDSLAGWVRPGSGKPSFATERIPISRQLSTPRTSRVPASLGQSNSTARRCPTTTTSTPMRHGVPHTTTDRPPSPSSSTQIRAGSRWVRILPRPTTSRSPPIRSRHSGEWSQPIVRCHGPWPRQWLTSSRRSLSRPTTRRLRWPFSPNARGCGSCAPRRAPSAGGPICGPSPVVSSCRGPMICEQTVTIRPPGAWSQARPSMPRRWRISPLPGGQSAHRSPMRSCSPRTVLLSASAWDRSIASMPPASPWRGRVRIVPAAR